LDLLQGIQSPNDLFPFPLQIGALQAALELLLEDQGEKTTKHMASNSLVALVADETGFKDGFFFLRPKERVLVRQFDAEPRPFSFC
jgi:hypothetical protein